LHGPEKGALRRGAERGKPKGCWVVKNTKQNRKKLKIPLDDRKILKEIILASRQGGAGPFKLQAR